MKSLFLMNLALLMLLILTACAEKAITISPSDTGKAGVKEAFIITTGLENDESNVSDENQESEELKPSIGIITPKDGEIFHNNTIFVRLNISNFELVSPDRYPKKGQGHAQVWFDDMEFRGSKTEFIFTNESNGMHIIKAELMLSNNTVLPYSKTIRVFINNTLNIQSDYVPKPDAQQEELKEFTVDADDNGFYPSKIQAKIGDRVKIDFRFRDDSIYFAGLDIKGPFPDIKYELKGEQPLTAEFTMKDETKIISYWPASGVKKAVLVVEVEN